MLDTTLGGPTADSYYTIEQFLAYHSAMGREVSATPLDRLEASARRTTLWLDSRYGLLYPGKPRYGRVQSLGWPRVGAKDREGFDIPDNEIPREIHVAAMEGGYVENLNPGTLSPTAPPARRIKRKKVGPIDTEYFDDGSRGDGPQAPLTVEQSLWRILKPTRLPSIWVV